MPRPLPFRKLPLAVHDRAGQARLLQIINFFDEFHQKHIFVFIIRRYYNKVKSVRRKSNEPQKKENSLWIAKLY